MVGRRLGRFTIRSLLGQGGMASVWKAHDELSGRDVALKVLSETLTSSPDACRRFRREAEIAALLDHPSIAPVYDTGEQDDAVYIAMALIEGKTLSDRLDSGLPPIAPALRTIATAAEALAYAHGRGVLHRDISSRNIMLGDDGRVFVLDFGLARALDRSRLSSSGTRLGTIAFMSPEVMRGEEADPRSDLYGLGVAAFHYLTGNFPFTGERDEVVVYQRLNTSITPPSALRSEIGAEIDAVLVRALAREPAERWQSASELAAALRALAEPGTNGGSAAVAIDAAAGPAQAAELASRIASGSATIYLGILPFADDATEVATRIVGGLIDATTSGLAQIQQVHIVPMAATQEVESLDELRSVARRSGANLVLKGSVRTAGTLVRASFSLLEPESGVQVAGGMIDGSATVPFEIEDRLVVAIRRALGASAADAPKTWRAPAHDPAAGEKVAQARAYLQRFDNEASLDGAIALIEGLLASEGESALLHATLARACLYKYRLIGHRALESQASSACDRAKVLDADAPEVRLATAELHLTAGRQAEALALLDALPPGWADQFETQLARAMALDGLGRAGEAEVICQRMIAARPGDWRPYHAMGMLLFRHGHFARALGPWMEVTRLVPDNASAFRNMGSALFQMDRPQEALASFQKSIDLHPNAMAFYNLGTVLYFLERYEESIPAFEKAVALNPSDPWSWGNLGSACRFIPGHEGRMREALERGIAMLHERLSRGPGEGQTWALLGSWYANLGNSDEAQRAIDRALEMSPDDAYCMVTAAATYLELGRRHDALRWLRRAVESGYGVGLLRRKRTLRALEGDPEFERILAEGSRRQGAGIESPGNGG